MGDTINRKNGLVVWQLLLIIVMIGVLLAAFRGVRRAQSDVWRVVCGGDLKGLWIGFNMYAGEHDGLLPPLSEGKGAWLYQPAALIPEYWPSLADACCTRYSRHFIRKARRKVFGHSLEKPREIQIDFDETNPETGYFYFNWVMTSDATARTVFDLYEELPSSAYSEDLTVPEGKGIGGTEIIPRVRLGLAESLGDDVSCPSDATIPVLMDAISLDLSKHNHRPAGANVAFLDGHVEFIEYPGKFPVTAMIAEFMDGHRVVIKPREFERH